MKVGLVNIFSFRPHVEHLKYLHKLLKDGGHETFFLTCDSSVSNCYPRALKETGRLKECSKCMLGGIRSYPVKNITSISDEINVSELSSKELDEMTLSSSCTLNRIESDLEWNDTELVSVRNSLHEPVNTVYRSAMKWISDYQLDAVICFNGRMDITRAVIYACEQSGIPYITHERTWFGDGLTLIPNANCLSLKALRKMVDEFDNRPLTEAQARLSCRLIALRFLQQNTLEWRIYNGKAKSIEWPISPIGRKVLVLPSSRNESSGHPEWKTGWLDNTSALDDFFVAFSINPKDVVIRFHPNWLENIGHVSGKRPLNHYTSWAVERGIHFISSEEDANTYDLIQQADIVVMNGGSSAIEAGACGKQVICLSPSSYDSAGFVRTFVNKDDLYRSNALIDIEPDIVMRKTLRYVYLRAKRFPQFVDFVKAVKTTEYQYFDGANSEKIIDMFKTGGLQADDRHFAINEREEDDIVNLLKEKKWVLLSDFIPVTPTLPSLVIQRRFGLRWLDKFRALMVRGDR